MNIKRTNKHIYLKKNTRGVIMLVVLWIMVVISILTLGLASRTRIDMSLTKYNIGKIKAYYIAQAGLFYVLDRIEKDTKHPVGHGIDTMYSCGITFSDNEIPNEVFENISLGDGYFAVSYILSDEENTIHYGLRDEDSKINLNAITQQSQEILSHLISLAGFDEDVALTIASSVVDWHDEDSTVTNQPSGAENDYYQSQQVQYNCKNMAFDSIEELLLVRGMSKEILSEIKDYITVFPKEASRLQVNVNTAPKIVIQALARKFSGQGTNTEIADADSLTEKLIAYRKGEDNIERTSDDRGVELSELDLNAKERTIFLSMKAFTKDTSDYLLVAVTGVDQKSKVESKIEAVVYRNDLSVVLWRRN